ncbi:MAG: sigma 54-interacting transcriptional regulator [Candidatus Binataceae bacterium]|jgi:DNA-binding NtrC family response regulator
MEPFARIALGQGAPADLRQLLNAIGLETLPEHSRHSAGLCVEFSGERPRDDHAAPVLRIAMNKPAGGAPIADFDSSSVHAIACFILSRALRLPAPFLTADPAMFNVIRTALTLARGPARIIVEGETGVGKQSLIRIVLEAAAPERIVRIDCASFDETAADSEFAATVRTLATPALDASPDTAASGGILFLNRVDELSLSAQRRLLGEIHSAPVIRPRIRYIATCTEPLIDLLERGRLVPELHNLFEVALAIAPLRQRSADIAMLAWHFLRGANPAMALNGAALKTLCDYPFPGNVRELQNLITRLAIVPLASDSSVIGRPDILSQLAGSASGRMRSLSHFPRAASRNRPRGTLAPIGATNSGAQGMRNKPNSGLRLTTAGPRRPSKPPSGPRVP